MFLEVRIFAHNILSTILILPLHEKNYQEAKFALWCSYMVATPLYHIQTYFKSWMKTESSYQPGMWITALNHLLFVHALEWLS